MKKPYFIRVFRPAKKVPSYLKNFMQAQKFYTGTKKDVVHHYIFFTKCAVKPRALALGI